jgi:hypothetical protein
LAKPKMEPTDADKSHGHVPFFPLDSKIKMRNNNNKKIKTIIIIIILLLLFKIN